MSLRGVSLLLVLVLGACSGSASPSAKKPEAMAANINPEMVRQYSRFLQQYISALLLCGSTSPGDWEEAKRQLDLIHPFFVFNEDPGLISDFKAGSVTARQELARRGAMLQSVMVLSSGVYDREKWDNARKVLMDAGEPGQVLLCTTLLKMLINSQHMQIWENVRFALVESGPLALETTVGLTREFIRETPADTAIFKMNDLVQLMMVVIAFGDAGAASFQEFCRDPKPNVRRTVARAIGESKDGSKIDLLVGLLRDDDWAVRMAACQALGQMASVRSIAGQALMSRLGKEKEVIVFRTALRALGDLLYVEAVPQLVRVLDLPSHDTAEVAMQALYIITGERFLRKEQWIGWFHTGYPAWKARQAAPR